MLESIEIMEHKLAMIEKILVDIREEERRREKEGRDRKLEKEST